MANANLTVPTEMLLRVFRHAARNRNFQDHRTFDLGRSRPLIRNFFEFAAVKLRYSTRVEYRFLVYGHMLNNITFENHRTNYVHEDIGWRGETQCKVVLVSDCQATQDSLPGTKLPQAGGRPPMELARPDERAYMRATLSVWRG